MSERAVASMCDDERKAFSSKGVYSADEICPIRCTEDPSGTTDTEYFPALTEPLG
jgi:hypothetical protein